MSRILRPGGLLITSTDYFPLPIDTKGATAYGAPVHIFSREEVQDAISKAEGLGLSPTGAVELDCKDKPICWPRFNLNFTFLTLTMRKAN